jgi:formimidoylglutamate deiminase
LGAGSDRSGPGWRADIVVLDVDHPDMVGSRGDLWLDQYVFVAGRRLVKTVLLGGVKLVDDCALCARAAIVSRYRKVVARIAGKAVI